MTESGFWELGGQYSNMRKYFTHFRNHSFLDIIALCVCVWYVCKHVCASVHAHVPSLEVRGGCQMSCAIAFCQYSLETGSLLEPGLVGFASLAIRLWGSSWRRSQYCWGYKHMWDMPRSSYRFWSNAGLHACTSNALTHSDVSSALTPVLYKDDSNAGSWSYPECCLKRKIGFDKIINFKTSREARWLTHFDISIPWIWTSLFRFKYWDLTISW